jgi:CPA1 family monovalent cation:H+ antiporter
MRSLSWSAAGLQSGLIEQELIMVVLLAVAALVAILSRRIRVPYTVSLVIVGLALAIVPAPIELDISNEVILPLLVPPLVFEAALVLPWDMLRRDLLPVLMLAIGGVFVGTLIVGGALSAALGLPVMAALTFGALISATDPVAVIAFFRRLGVSKRLAVLIEGESLFNDGVAIVVFGLAVSGATAVAAGTWSGPSIGAALVEFARVSLGGVVLGLALGYIVSQVVLRNVDDQFIETSTTVALAFGAYVLSEIAGFSGILSVVAAGLVVGSVGLAKTSPTTRVTLNNFWEFMAFMANSLVFLIIGLKIDVLEVLPDSRAILVAVAAVLIARVVVVYSLTWLHSVIDSENSIPLPYRHVMFWGGLRGAISLALAMTLTAGALGGEMVMLVRHMTFGVVLFTLLVQGTTIERLIRRLGLSDRSVQREQQQTRQARIYAARAAKRELNRLRGDGIISQSVWQAMAQAADDDIDERAYDLRAHLDLFPELELEMVMQARVDLLHAERSAIADAARRSLITEEAADELTRDIDRRTAALGVIAARLPGGSGAWHEGSRPELED